MRFRKFAGLAAGALTVGVMSAPGLVAPAQAAPSTTESFVSTLCAYNQYKSSFQSDYDVVVDGTDVTVTFDKPFNPGFGATPTFSYIEPQLVLDIDGESVTVIGKQEFTPPGAGNSDLALPVLTGELDEAAAGDSVSLTSIKFGMQINVQAGPNLIHPIGAMDCVLDKKSTFEADCAAAGFHMYYPVEAYTRVDGTAVSSYLRNALVPGMPAFLSVAAQASTLKLKVNNEDVTLTGTRTYTPPLPGNSSFPMPAVTGTRAGAGALSTVTIEDFDTNLTVGTAATAVPCEVYAPKTTTTTSELTCVYSTFVMPYNATLTTTYDRKNVTATLSDATFSVMPANFQINSIKADLTAKAGTVPITLASETKTFAPALAGNAALSISNLTGTTGTPQIPSATSFDLLTLTLNIKTPFGPTATDATIKCAVAAATNTTLTATSTAANTVALAATVNKTDAPGKVEFFEGTTKVGDTVTVAAGKASTTVANVAAGAHSYTAKFTPTEQFRFVTSTSAAANVAVSAAATSTTLTATSGAPNAVSLAAKVAPTAAGKVEFYEGTTKVGETVVATGAAALALTGVTAGSHSYTAKFVPTDATRFAGSTSAAATVAVAAAGPSAACVAAEANVKAALTKVKAADTKVKGTKAAVKKAQAKVKKATKAVKKASKAKKAKAKKQLKAAKSSLKKAQGKAKAASKKLSSEKTKHAAAVKAASAAC